jgi:hypothetical protein
MWESMCDNFYLKFECMHSFNFNLKCKSHLKIENSRFSSYKVWPNAKDLDPSFKGFNPAKMRIEYELVHLKISNFIFFGFFES